MTAPSILDLIPAAAARTLPGLLRARIARDPEGIAYEEHDRRTDTWRGVRWREIGAQVARWRLGFAREGLTPGDRVGVLIPNSAAWICFDLAAQASGLVVVPLYMTDSAEGAAHTLTDSGARLLLIGSEAHWDAIAGRVSECPALRTVLCLDAPARPPLILAAHWLPAEGTGAPGQDSEPEGLATIIYTSGTTGPAKGVMLSHRNILSVAEAALARNPVGKDDIFLSVLPLAHVFERVIGCYLPMMAGASVVFVRSAGHLAEDLIRVRPTILLGVPRLYEHVHDAIGGKAGRHALTAILLRWAETIGWRRFEASCGRAPQPGLRERLLWTTMRPLFADRLRARFGGRLRLAVSGGAALPTHVAHRLVGLGLTMIEGYGLTETASAVSCDDAAHPVPGSAGPPLLGVEVMIGEDGELLVRGPGVMPGYWGQPATSRAAIDPTGWFHTGDIAVVRDGRLFIQGRLKEILVTSTGEKVDPAALEMAITADPLFEQAMVVGEGRAYLGALLVLRHDRWVRFASRLGLDPGGPAAIRDPRAAAAVLAHLSGLLAAFPRYARVLAVHLSLEPYTTANGLLTPTLKLRRGRLEAHFAREIEALYVRNNRSVDSGGSPASTGALGL
jgi:long-chain acyl-CoA synthetase